jgi:hypothetical protein
MRTVFVDTSALIAMCHYRDQFYHQATKIFQKLLIERYKFVTTRAVVFELGNAFSTASVKPLFLRLIDQIHNSSKWTIISIDEQLFENGLARLRQMNDKDWSLVDCISMVVAEDMGISEIFTNDHHFEQAGFIRLLK